MRAQQTGKTMPDWNRPAIVAIVEDNASMLRSLQRLLVMEGFSTEGYGSAEAFLHRTANDQIQCLVLDVQLPRMSGIELWQQISSENRDLPVIFITAIEDVAMQQAAVEVGCAAYLRKPFEPEALVAAVKGALGSP